MNQHLSKCALFLFVLLAAITGTPQERRVFTTADYARAEKAMGYNTNQLVFRTGVRPNWLPGDRFWYRVTTPEGSEFVMVDAVKGSRAPAFDHARLAAAISAAAGQTYDAH